MDLEELKQAARHTRADAAEAKTHDARVDLARAANQFAMTAEICERLERIEAAIRALGPVSRRVGEPSDSSDVG